MTVTDSNTSLELATAVGETVAALLPADEAWSVRAGDEIDLPGKPQAVGAQVDDHVVVFIVSSDLTRRIKVGPPPAEGLLDGLFPSLQAVSQVLGLTAPEALIEMDPRAVVAETPPNAFGCMLLDGEQHLVTVIVTPPATESREEAHQQAEFAPIVGAVSSGTNGSGLEVLHDVELGVTVELGRTRMQLRDILSVVPGSVIELDRAASAPVDVLVNGTLIARGEVVVIDEEFGIRITEVIGHQHQPTRDELAP